MSLFLLLLLLLVVMSVAKTCSSLPSFLVPSWFLSWWSSLVHSPLLLS